MSKRKQRIAAKDQQDFKSFAITVGVIVLVLIILVFTYFLSQSS
jgi:hypothetical protein